MLHRNALCTHLLKASPGLFDRDFPLLTVFCLSDVGCLKCFYWSFWQKLIGLHPSVQSLYLLSFLQILCIFFSCFWICILIYLSKSFGNLLTVEWGNEQFTCWMSSLQDRLNSYLLMMHILSCKWLLWQIFFNLLNF